MRFENKYKPFNSKKKNLSLDIPWRILKFKRTKWERIISNIKRSRRLFPLINLKTSIKLKYKKKIIIKQIKQNLFRTKKKSLYLLEKNLFTEYFYLIGRIRLISISSRFDELNKNKFFIKPIKECIRRSKFNNKELTYPLNKIKVYIPPKITVIPEHFPKFNIHKFYKNLRGLKQVKIYSSIKFKTKIEENVNLKLRQYLIIKKQTFKNKRLMLPKDFKFFETLLKLKPIFKKQKFLKRIKNKEPFKAYTSFRNLKIRCPIKNWTRNALYYKNSLLLQKYFRLLYDSNIAYKKLKRIVFTKKKIKTIENVFRTLFSLEFRLDVLLWKLRFFKSTFEARIYLNAKSIQVNSKYVRGNYTLKKGDIITFESDLHLIENLIRLKKNFLLKNWVEIDYYSNTIIILQSSNGVDLNNSMFQLRKYFDVFKFHYSFK